MFWKIKSFLYVGIGASVVTATGLFYVHYNKLVSANKLLNEQKTINEIAIKSLEVQVLEWDKRWTETNEANKILQMGLKSAQEETTRLQSLFREHNLTDLATKKPKLIEKRINDGTKKVFDDIESISAD